MIALVSVGLTISGIQTWLLATLIIWLASMFTAWILPVLILKGLLGAWLRHRLQPKSGTSRKPQAPLF